MKLSYFPNYVIKHYKLKDKVDAKGNVYVKYVCSMYGLPHAGIITQQLLETRLNGHGYYHSTMTHGWHDPGLGLCQPLGPSLHPTILQRRTAAVRPPTQKAEPPATQTRYARLRQESSKRKRNR